MLPGLQAGLSALRAAQVGLDVTANNLANANSEGYHRQRVELVENRPVESDGLLIGTGVDVAAIERFYDRALESQLNQQRSVHAASEAYLQSAQKVEAVVAPASESLGANLARFFDTLTELTQDPTSLPLRRQLLDAAQSVASELNHVSAALDEMATGSDQAVGDLVGQANSLVAQIEVISDDIRYAQARGLQPNDLLDRRDQLVGQLSEIVDVEIDDRGNLFFAANDRWMIGTQRGDRIELVENDDGIFLKINHSEDLFLPASGQLSGLLAARNELIDQQRSDVEQLTGLFSHSVNEYYAMGLPAGQEGHQSWLSTVPELKTLVPLQSLPLVPPVEPGTMFVGVTDTATGERQVTRLDIDPTTQSLADVAALLDGVGHLQASVDAATGRMQIDADGGYRFDFTNQVATLPDMTLMTGTAVPRFSGQVTTPENGLIQLSVRGSGDVGVSSNLTVDVIDQSGQRLTSVDVGAGYAPEQLVELGNGLSVRFSSGSLVNGDSALLETNGLADTTGLLGSLGFQPLFVGSTPETIRVNSQLLARPDQLATSGTGAAGSSTALVNINRLRDAGMFSDDLTAEGFVTSWQANLGLQVQRGSQNLENAGTTLANLQHQRDALSGVDPNEEMVRLLEFQRMFQAGAQVIRTIQETTDEIMHLIQ